ncbi:CRISPR-associated RAMP protein [candidate division KSB1 bacterium]|nr:CRISPR-associated RAMP protein [candidate division KSB1 bacterium]
MLKKRLNECQFTLALEIKGPFLIKDGRYKKKEWEKRGRLNKNVENPDAIFVCQNSEKQIKDAIENRNNYSSLQFFVPGTSLRGWIRSHAEKIIRTLSGNGDPYCCDPFDTNTTNNSISCSQRLDNPQEKLDTVVSYANICLVCKLFGCTASASRIAITDSNIVHQNPAKFRDGVGIDRFTGGSSTGALFKNHVLTNAAFTSQVTIRNFEIWQLGLLAYVLRDLENEQVPLGFGKSKGFGKVKATVNNLSFIYYGGEQGIPIGIGDMMSKDDVLQYGLVPSVDIMKAKLEQNENGWYYRNYKLSDQPPENTPLTLQPFWQQCAEGWNAAWTGKTVDGKKFFSSVPDLNQKADVANEESEETMEVAHE